MAISVLDVVLMEAKLVWKGERQLHRGILDRSAAAQIVSRPDG